MARLNEQQKDRARDLRGRMTDAERKLWYEYLASCGHRFRRQHPIGPFFADFFCHTAGLIIEVDGGQHYTDRGIAQDRSRTRYLESQGFRVMRFTDTQVLTEFSAVCEAIELAFEEKPSLASPSGGSGSADPIGV